MICMSSLGQCNLWSLKKFISAYLFQIAWEKSFDDVLTIYQYMKKYKIAYHNYAEAKRVHQVRKQVIQILLATFCVLVKTTAYDQNNNTQWYFHIFKVQKSSKSS